MNHRTYSGLSRFALLGLLAALGTIGHADDWRMYRKDAQHTAASSDKIKLPLKEAWVWKSARLGGVAPLSTAVVAGDRVYFCGGQTESGKTSRQLLAVDTATGKVVWKRNLLTARMNRFLSEDVGPVVSLAGNVYAFDINLDDCHCDSPVAVQAFDPNGKPIESRHFPTREGLSRLFLRTSHEDEADFLLTANAKPPH